MTARSDGLASQKRPGHDLLDGAKRLDASLTDAASFAPSDQGLRLGRAFVSIENPELRAAIVEFVEKLSRAAN